MRKGQGKIDEFAFILLAGVVFIIIALVAFTSIKESVGVVPDKISLILQKGSSSTFILSVNGSARVVKVNATGEIIQFLSFDRNEFELNGIVDLTGIVNIPTAANEKIYRGTIEVSFLGGKKIIPVEIDVRRTVVVKDIARNIRIGDFTVSFKVGSDVIATKENFEVKRGYFSSSHVSFVSDVIDEDRLSTVTGGFISLLIEDTNSAGNLIIEINGKEIFNQAVGIGELQLPISKDLFNKTNVITIKSGLPGFRFWVTSSYKIKTAKLGIDFQGIISKDFSFSLSSDEVNKLRFGRVQFNIGRADSRNNLVVTLNDQLVFSNRVTTSPFNFDFESGQVSLNPGINAISFSAERDALYSLQDVTLIIVRRA